MASLAQKDVTQAMIVGKLASYEQQNQTKKVLSRDPCKNLQDGLEMAVVYSFRQFSYPIKFASKNSYTYSYFLSKQY
jgi:hypothetical protein